MDKRCRSRRLFTLSPYREEGGGLHLQDFDLPANGVPIAGYGFTDQLLLWNNRGIGIEVDCKPIRVPPFSQKLFRLSGIVGSHRVLLIADGGAEHVIRMADRFSFTS